MIIKLCQTTTHSGSLRSSELKIGVKNERECERKLCCSYFFLTDQSWISNSYWIIYANLILCLTRGSTVIFVL